MTETQPGFCEPGQCPACDSTAAQPRARTLADDPLPPIDPDDERIVDELMHKRAQALKERPMKPEPPASEPSDPIATSRKALELLERADRPMQLSSHEARTGFRNTIRHALDTLERDRAAHAAEVERLKRMHSELLEAHIEEDRESAEEVERLRGELGVAKANRDTFLRDAEHALAQLDEVKAELAAARAERPMPTDAELAKALRNEVIAEDVRNSGDPEGCEVTWEESSEWHREHWRSVARAAKAALLGVRREGPFQWGGCDIDECMGEVAVLYRDGRGFCAEHERPEPEPLRGTVVVPHPPRKVLASAEFTVEPPAREPSDPIATLRRVLPENTTGVMIRGGILQETLAALDTLERDRAAHASTQTQLEECLDLLRQTSAELEADRAAHAADIERLKQQHEADFQAFTDSLPPWEGIASQRAAEAERLRGELGVAKANRDTFLRDAEHALAQLDEVKAELAAARAERPEPSDATLARMLWEAWYGKAWGEPPTDADAPYAYRPNDFTEVARAAKSALLGVRREGPTREEAIAAADAAVAEWAETDDDDPRPSATVVAVDAVLALFGAEPKGQPEPTLESIIAALDKVYGEKLADRAPVAARAIRALFQQVSAGTPGPRSSLENTGASATGGAGSNPDGGRPAETTDALAGMPTPWRDELARLGAECRDLDRRVDHGSKRLDELERAVEGLKGGGR